MLINILYMINNSVSEVKVDGRNIFLDGKKKDNIEYILFTSFNKKYYLKFFNIYEKLMLCIPITLNTSIELSDQSLFIKTI